MFTRCGLLTLICIASCAGQGGEGRVVGRVVDSDGRVLTEAVVRLTQDDGGPTLLRTQTGADGGFALDHMRPGVYAVRIWKERFREKTVHRVVVPTAGTAGLKTVWLALVGCDGPNVTCEYHDWDPLKVKCAPRMTANLLVKRGCGINLDGGRTACDHADFLIVPGEGGALYLRPAKGVQITVPNSQTRYSSKPVRIDGFGRGNDLWVVKRHGSYSHVFIMDVVEPDSAEVRLWYKLRPCFRPWEETPYP